jgi:hypothetical protein
MGYSPQIVVLEEKAEFSAPLAREIQTAMNFPFSADEQYHVFY